MIIDRAFFFQILENSDGPWRLTTVHRESPHPYPVIIVVECVPKDGEMAFGDFYLDSRKDYFIGPRKLILHKFREDDPKIMKSRIQEQLRKFYRWLKLYNRK